MYQLVHVDASKRFREIIVKICSPETSSDPEHWSPENPLWGHCAVVSLLAQDQFGGLLMRQSLEGVAGLEYIRSHYSNRLIGGIDIDFTHEQFRGRLPEGLAKEERTREYVLSHPATARRYELLKSRFDAEMM